jgi:hypothetical protein
MYQAIGNHASYARQMNYGTKKISISLAAMLGDLPVAFPKEV